MSDYLLDTNILIRYLRKTKGFRDLLSTLVVDDWLCISVVTRFEVVRGMHDREHQVTFALLNSFETIPISSEIADMAGELVRSWRTLGKAFDDADALIAATALHHRLALLTTNAKHFPMPDLIVFKADEQGKIT